MNDKINARFELWQHGFCEAATEGPQGFAYKEIMHYAMVYGQDGPVTIYRCDDKGNRTEAIP